MTEVMQSPMKMVDEGRSGEARDDRRAKDHRNTPQCQLTEWKNVALRKCSRKISGAAIVKNDVPGISAKTPVGE